MLILQIIGGIWAALLGLFGLLVLVEYVARRRWAKRRVVELAEQWTREAAE